MQDSSVFNFTDPVEFLNYMLEAKKQKNPSFSLRAWARQLGYQNPSFLSHILKNERSLKLDVAEKFISNLKLTKNAKKYFELLILIKNSRGTEEKNMYLEMLDSTRPQNQESIKSIDLEIFKLISEWHHWAILEMVELHDFKNEDEYIFHRLGDLISRTQIRKAIQRLILLELIQESTDGKLFRPGKTSVLMDKNIPSNAVRHFHTQMIEKAKIAIEEQSINERDIRGSTVSVHKNDYEKAQSIIKKAHAEIVKLSTRGTGDEVYHFNTQFFKLTKEVKK